MYMRAAAVTGQRNVFTSILNNIEYYSQFISRNSRRSENRNLAGSSHGALLMVAQLTRAEVSASEMSAQHVGARPTWRRHSALTSM